MIGTVTNHFTFAGSASALPNQAAKVRRRISSEAGHALEKLGHAIEYLTDEFMNEEGRPPFRRDGRLEAIEILMAANRRVYLDCPQLPSLRERLSSLIHRHV
ncbi:MAG TPA: hypothetical protein VGL22_01210 [Terracidiphilus sp.]